MMTQNNESLATQQRDKFILPEMIQSDFTADELSEDMDGLRMSLPRVKIPGGGALQFEIPTDDPENPDYSRTLEGVILYSHASNAYWLEGSEYDDNTPPACQSMDGKLGHGDPGGLCASCGYNQFGTGPKGSGKACKNMRILYLLCSGSYMPLQISLPPTSLKSFNQFVNQAFFLRQRGICSGVVQISLKKMNNGTNDYSVALFKKLYDFDGEELAKIRAYADAFREQAKAMLAQQAELAATDQAEMCAIPAELPDNDVHFSIGSVVNAERDPLPA